MVSFCEKFMAEILCLHGIIFAIMKTEKVQFKNSKGLLLRGYFDLPENGETKVFAVFSHCFTCSKDLKAIANIDSLWLKQELQP
jgi:hypothetical protein